MKRVMKRRSKIIDFFIALYSLMSIGLFLVLLYFSSQYFTAQVRLLIELPAQMFFIGVYCCIVYCVVNWVTLSVRTFANSMRFILSRKK